MSQKTVPQPTAIVEAGPDRDRDGVVRWRRIDLKRVVKERFHAQCVSSSAMRSRCACRQCRRTDGDMKAVSIGRLRTILKRLGFSHLSVRPLHPKQNGEIVEAFKKTSRLR